MILLKHLREKANITQVKLADDLNVAQNTISNWENGTREPNSDMLKKLALYFGVSIDFLVGYKAQDGKDYQSFNEIEEAHIVKEEQPDYKTEIDELIETLRNRPEIKTLFELGKNATEKDVETVVKMMEIITGKDKEK